MGSNQEAGGRLTVESPIFFVCGTPNDRHGFEFKEIGDQRLPGRSKMYLDAVARERLPKREKPTFALARIGKAAVYAEYRWIQPNDTERNRGAYIAAGCWVESPLAPAQAVEALQRTEAIHEDLAQLRDSDTDAFPPNFRLREYNGPVRIDGHRLQWADLFSQAASGTGEYNDGEAVILTSEEVAQGALSVYAARTETSESELKPPRLANSDRRDRRALLQEVVSDLRDEAPQISRALRHLMRLEEDRAKAVNVLTRAVANTPQRRPVPDTGFGGLRRRELVFSAIAALAMLAVVGAVLVVTAI